MVPDHGSECSAAGSNELAKEALGGRMADGSHSTVDSQNGDSKVRRNEQ